jgi:hypothetical protein
MTRYSRLSSTAIPDEFSVGPLFLHPAEFYLEIAETEEFPSLGFSWQTKHLESKSRTAFLDIENLRRGNFTECILWTIEGVSAQKVHLQDILIAAISPGGIQFSDA